MITDGVFRHPTCAKKNELMIINNNENADRKALLENVLFGDREMFNDETWEGGILAIGTLGFDQMNAVNLQDEQLGDVEEFEDDEEEEEDSEEYYNEDYGDSDSGITTTYDDEDDEEKEELNPLMFNAAIFSCNNNNNQMVRGSHVSLAVCDSNNKKRERITLADLFSADTNSGGQQDVILHKSSASHGGRGDHSTTKPPPLPVSSLPTKTGLSFAKKIIPKLVGDQRPRRPINKLHQVALS